MQIYESGENYLETIYILKQNKANVRAVDIIEELGYSKSSVSRAVNLLKDKGYITISDKGFIDFTEKGNVYVKNLYERHKVLTKAFLLLGVDEKIAEKDACRIEHIISQQTFYKIKEHINKFN